MNIETKAMYKFWFFCMVNAPAMLGEEILKFIDYIDDIEINDANSLIEAYIKQHEPHGFRNEWLFNIDVIKKG